MRFFERFLPRVVAVLITYLLLIGAISLVLFLIFPPLVRQVVELVDDAPNIADDLRTGAVSLIDGSPVRDAATRSSTASPPARRARFPSSARSSASLSRWPAS